MIKELMTSCGVAEHVPSRRDAMLGALAMIVGSLVLVGAGLLAKRAGYVQSGETVLGMAFPASLLLSFPFTYLKGRSWKLQVMLVGVPMVILVVIGFLAAKF